MEQPTTSPDRRGILISGGSIAGLTLAYWLRRYGFDVTVVERAPAPRPGGQAVDLRGVAKQVAERMGVLPAIERARVRERGLAYVDASGKRSAAMPAELFDGEGAVAEIEILRGDLTDILYAAARSGVEYLFGDTVTALRETRDGIAVSFQHNPSRVFDLVIGADGLHSNVRRLAFGPESEFVHHLGAYLAYFTVPVDGLELDDWFLMHNAPGGLLAAIRPESPSAAKAMFGFKAAELVYDRHDIAGQQRILSERFAETGWHTPRLLAAMHQAPDFFFDTISQTRMDRWSHGRVALVGDAGYCGSPLSGNGTAMAMVGAYVLAGELAHARNDHATAFTRYQEVLRPYVTECQQLPPGGVNGFLPAGRAAITVRNLSVRLMTSKPFRGLMAKSLQKADAITLPNYRESSAHTNSRN
ncbi:FAD-dependent monooxygenase [Nocardia yamanashiensis]|uniref:FAD-dependent monooxygenase n=1 Tax=Nocardia yamanashiensis TaxID=209247 RepID=UPI001E2DD925|nr:FAD-dependent monooxygenase [Nocardia yamanashiensis]UGT38548.1 FAD-dependent monooxygenase [Nocardia yamanashiensis]